MTTIDHAAEARAMIRNAHKAVAKATINACLAEAQVHAQLALAEQQRIASIIALGETLDYRNTYMGEAQMRHDIKKGLGL